MTEALDDRSVQAALPGTDTPAEGRPVLRCKDCHRPVWSRLARIYGRGSQCQHQLALTPPRGHVDQDQIPGLDPE